jgi:hypothetical protein
MNQLCDPEYGSKNSGIWSEDFKKAVAIVREELSEDTANILRHSLKQTEQDQKPFEQKDLGIAFRNLLARNGIIWEDAIFFSVWFAILRQALETFLDS